MRGISLSIFIIYSFVVFGQDYNYKASVSNINKDGFCKIQLSPEITSKLNSDFTDIRIYDTANVEIPYIFQEENPVNEIELFTEYKIIEKTYFKEKSYTRIVIQNPSKTKINNIVLRIKNADVRKQLKLNASYDNKNWYVLKDNYYYNSINNKKSTSEIRVLNFPLSDYEYYELLIGDFFDKPINIVQAGYYDLIKENGKYSEIEDISFLSFDTLKQTQISIPINNNYIDKMSFVINNPKYYNREASIYVHKSMSKGKRKKIYEKQIANFNLISNSSNSFSINNLQADTIFVRIKNNDNQALSIDKIRLYQLNKYLTSELNSNNLYHISFSDKNAKKPIYDLKYFSNKIPKNLKVIEVNHIQKISKTEKKNNNINFSNYWLWIIIVGLAGLLAYMSYSMIKDKKE